jgi:DNA-binding GntR family transcriptional regulator
VTPEGHERSKHEHQQLVAALESRDRELIRKIIRQHSEGTLERVLETMAVTAGGEGELPAAETVIS